MDQSHTIITYYPLTTLPFLSASQQSGGQWNGNLAISVIEDDSITKIDYTDTIPIRFINPETNVAMGLESGVSCTNGRKVVSQTRNGGDGQTFFLKRITDSNKLEIHSKACPGMMLEIAGGVCDIALIILMNQIRNDKRNQWKITNGKIESAMCGGMVMEIHAFGVQIAFPDKATLGDAVTSYINEGCADDSDCAIGQIWGHPMNVWKVGEITDFSYLFSGTSINGGDDIMKTFNENIASWDTSKVSDSCVCGCIYSINLLLTFILACCPYFSTGH